METITVTQYTDLTATQLVDMALKLKEGVLSTNQALAVDTGKRTGRSPKDRFIVKDNLTATTVDWGKVNQPFAPEQFAKLWQRAKSYMQQKTMFISHLQVGADDKYSLPVKVITELAWHNLFARNLFMRTGNPNLAEDQYWTILSAPGFHCQPERDGTNSETAIILDFSSKKILVCGTAYAGEIKKAMFSVLNFLLPDRNVLPMHCAANVGADGDVALFFGLSGTGKTTLSADPERSLIGDDEHGWSQAGVFNFEGGCYAKCINLSLKKEPVIWQAIRYGAIMENVVLIDGTPDYDSDKFTNNTRAAYPLEHIPLRIVENRAGHPQAVIFLTCDLYGVLPPVAILTHEQAAYHFLSGYTALVGSTEVGSTASITSTFSTCFGAPFFSRPAGVYADLLLKRLTETNCPVYLVNTGWTGGSYGTGERFDIPTTRAVIRAILTGAIKKSATTILPGFNFTIPTTLPGVSLKLLDPKQAWPDPQAYDVQLKELMQKFAENFQRFTVTDAIKQAGPTIA